MTLVMTSAGQRLNTQAAASYERLNAAFTKRFGKRLNITSGARTYDEQVAIFKRNNQLTPIKWSNGQYITRRWNGQIWYLKPGYATAAVPGTSNHEYPPGRAADFGSGVQTRGSSEHNWMLANAGSYGWEWTGKNFVTVEPWHFEHTGSSSGGGQGDDDMSVEDIYNARDNDGRNMLDLGRQTRSDIANLRSFVETIVGGVPAAVWKYSVPAQDGKGNPLLIDGKPVLFSASGFIASTNAAVSGKVADVDEVALAQALAPLITQNLSALSTEDIAKIAKATADEQARRLSA